jgi:signal peptidase II
LKQARKYFLIALIIIIVDQATKLLIKLNMEYGKAIPVLGDFFKIQFIENRGAAFGFTIPKLLGSMGIDMTPETGKLILTIFSIVAVGAIGYMLYRLSKHKSPLPFYLAFIFGGAIGNIIDRTFYGIWFAEINNYEGGLFFGRVVDFLYFDIYDGPWPSWVPFVDPEARLFLWPIFNVADAAISIGIVVLLIYQGKFFKMHEQQLKQAGASGSSTDEDKEAKPSEPNASPKDQNS